MPDPSERLAGATRRGHTRAPEAQKPSKCPCLTKLPREMCPQLIVSKALSWGTIRKSAWILAEITYRKSQVFARYPPRPRRVRHPQRVAAAPPAWLPARWSGVLTQSGAELGFYFMP